MRTGSVLRNQRVSPKPGLPSGFPLGSFGTENMFVIGVVDVVVGSNETSLGEIKSGQFVQGITL